MSKLDTIAKRFLKMFLKRHNNTLRFQCLRASCTLAAALSELGYHCETVEGWFIVDRPLSQEYIRQQSPTYHNPKPRYYSPHTWVIVDKKYIVDVTVSQFAAYLKIKLPSVLIAPVNHARFIAHKSYSLDLDRDRFYTDSAFSDYVASFSSKA